jgi:hypothetical protein
MLCIGTNVSEEPVASILHAPLFFLQMTVILIFAVLNIVPQISITVFSELLWLQTGPRIMHLLEEFHKNKAWISCIWNLIYERDKSKREVT